MKRLYSIIALILTVCMLLTACGKNGGGNGDGGGSGSGSSNALGTGIGDGKDSTVATGKLTGVNTVAYNPPAKIMTTEEYHQELNNLLAGDTVGNADDAYLTKLDNLTDSLKAAIVYNTDDIKPSTTGTTYYVSPSGDDNNDGKSPEKAWLTLERVRKAKFEAGDVLLFERGGEYRGWFTVRSDFKVGAYGTGHKPKIICAQSDKSLGGWEKTDTENIWKLKKEVTETDVGHLVYYLPDGQEICGDKFYTLDKLTANYAFLHNGKTTQEKKRDNFIYIYYDGDPNKDFVSIEIPYDTTVILTPTTDILQNCEIKNLDISHGRGPFWPAKKGAKNISFTYCKVRWCGGSSDRKGSVRYHGGSGVWHNCDVFIYDYCWFSQQYDSGVSPQYDDHSQRPDAAIFKDFKVTNSVFETTEYTLEYFNSQSNTKENRYEGMYFAYNICREGGKGFGTKPGQSAYIKSFGHENSCYDCTIEYNVFDRAIALTLEMVGHDQTPTGNVKTLERIPKLNKNIYIQIANRRFANINEVNYRFTETDLQKFIDLGIDTGSRYMFAAK